MSGEHVLNADLVMCACNLSTGCIETDREIAGLSGYPLNSSVSPGLGESEGLFSENG